MIYSSLPSGKHTTNYGKSPFFMGKSTINGPCSIAMLNYKRAISVKPIVTANFYT
jgi:hypothetical protein